MNTSFKFFGNSPAEIFKLLPKVELHRHLEGALRFDTMYEIALQHLKPPYTEKARLRQLVQIQESDPYTFKNFLSKFDTIRLFYRTPEIIKRIAREAVEDAAKDNIRYMELRFTPVALSRIKGFPMAEVMDWVIDSVEEASREFKVTTRLIASVNRHENTKLAEEVAQLSADRISKGVVALDLAGNEAMYPSFPFTGIFKEARNAGLHITIHAGEWGHAANIIEAIESLGAERIGHGVRVFENPDAVKLAKERGTVFEVCPTSNYQSGVLSPKSTHPLVRMLDTGLKLTLNTDDPGISNIWLANEYDLAVNIAGLSKEQLRSTILQAGEAAFLAPEDANGLAQALAVELDEVMEA